MLTAEELGRLNEILARKTGIVLSGRPTTHLADLVSHRMRALGLASVAAYLAELSREEPSDRELRSLVTVVTVGETWFHRDASQCEAVMRLLSQIPRSRRPAQIWSAGCATGEEPYTLAMLATEVGVSAEVLGTDINGAFLGLAERGSYGAWSLRHLPPRLRQNHFEQEGDRFRVRDPIRKMVRFQAGNLLRAIPRSRRPDGTWDVIWCRNVFIYFDRTTTVRVASDLLQALGRSGRLFLGASESLQGTDAPGTMERVIDAFCYQLASHVTVARPPMPSPAPIPVLRIPRLEVPPRVGSALAETAKTEPATNRPVEETSAPPAFLQGRRLLDEGRPEQAIERLEAAREEDPLRPGIHYYLAVALRQLGEMQRCEEALRRALFLDPGFWPAQFVQANLDRERGRRDAARAGYRRVLRILDEGGRLEEEERSIVPYRNEIVKVCRRFVEGSRVT